MFDSHVAALLDASVALVNALTDGSARGKPYVAPRDAQLAPAILAALLPGGEHSPEAAPDALAPEQAAYLAAAARQLRAVFTAVDTGDLDAAAAALNPLLRSSGARPQLDRVAGEPWQLHFHGSDDSFAVGWTAGCATALALAVGSDLAGRLGVCQAARCDRVFVDGSRNAGRQFCSTACQNRVKAAAFRARRTDG
ncbi:CGNR zinc finger domain-containing protein [Kitasatospora sp. NBC_01287]|uniref:CGNR zinc finger domain-containing protein n=1 Tax=Kitasatospora sp. NBC_01287 TaxID=2903573 RepID=UPI00225A98EF|nr:CGNR zinc finger domain-containing protein [Kitasatospora sp. NBC_01287]MCX4744319.1 CGNR zinc finger domain-containing protein [Kitasatospora sp. NBC_01287]